MAKIKFNKLVRDLIPEKIKNNGENAIFHIADEEEFNDKIMEKLGEEIVEYIEAETPIERAEELADILEVIHTLAKKEGITPQVLENLRIAKANKRGTFSKRIILDETN